MRTLRTLFWVVITALLVAFIAMNWHYAPVNVWPQDAGYRHFNWPVGIIALVFFLLGLAPMWLLHKATRWSMRRKLDSAERALASVKPVYPAAPAAPPAQPLPPSPDLSPNQDDA